MPEGQINTIRDEATGQLRTTTAEEKERFGFSNITPPPPAAGAVTQRDVDFVGQGSEVEPPPLPPAEPGAQPPPLPPQAPPVQPPPLPPAQPQEAGGQVESAIAGAEAGSRFGPAGALLGVGAGLAAGKLSEPSPIGTLEGGASRDDSNTLRELLAVQQQIARTGSPIKDAITTNPAGSRM